jgi:hypothetical protein
MKGVKRSRVHLATPSKSTFVEDQKKATASVVLAVTAGCLWVPENRELVKTYADEKNLWLGAETALRNDGVRHASQVFTDSFDFYFVSVRSKRSWDYRPRNTGGWAQVDLYGYDKVYPPLRTGSLDQLLTDCRAYGVTHLVLTSTARLALEPLGEILAGRSLPAGLRHVQYLPGMRIVAITGW